jgi:hypothetical protein
VSGVLVVAVAVAALAHVVVGFFYLTSGLVAPLWAIVGLLVVWCALAMALGRLARRRSFWVLAVPVVAAVVWVAVLSAGGAWLGWTA